MAEQRDAGLGFDLPPSKMAGTSLLAKLCVVMREMTFSEIAGRSRDCQTRGEAGLKIDRLKICRIEED